MAERAVSQIQRHFQTHSIYKRSKRYLDVQKMNQQQRVQEIKRRSPTISIETLDTRVDNSFVNYHQVNQQKRSYDINRFRRIPSIQFQQSQIDVPINESIYEYQKLVAGVKPSPRGFNMDRMRSREEQAKRLQPKSISMVERQFDNFKFTNFRPKIAVDFNKSLTRQKREQSNSPKSFPLQNQLTNPQDIKEKLAFNNSSFKCLFDYQKMAKQKADKQQQQPKAVQMDRIDRGLSFTSPFRANGIASFYGLIGKETAGTMDMRLKKPTQFFYKSQAKNKKKKDYLIEKMRQDSFDKKISDIKIRRAFINDRGEMCDMKYFRRIAAGGSLLQ